MLLTFVMYVTRVYSVCMHIVFVIHVCICLISIFFILLCMCVMQVCYIYIYIYIYVCVCVCVCVYECCVCVYACAYTCSLYFSCTFLLCMHITSAYLIIKERKRFSLFSLPKYLIGR